MTLLVTGAAGFIGSHFVRLIRREHPEWKVVVLDALTYAGNLETIADFLPEITFVHGDIQDSELVDTLCRDHKITHIVNFAAESHNDRSILAVQRFIVTNVMGVANLLGAAREFGIQKMVHVSTDEVYGSIAEGEFTEQTPLQPNTPYSASKAGGDLQCRAAFQAYRTPVCITRGGNTYGPYQYPEKLISFFAVRLIQGKKVPLYGDGSQVREWIYVEDHCRGILKVLLQGEPGRIYNIGDQNERSNRWITDRLLNLTGRDAALVKSIPDPRKGAHDARYSMTCVPLSELGWSPQKDFETGLAETVRWYQENESWWSKVCAKPDYAEFVERFYGPGLGEDL